MRSFARRRTGLLAAAATCAAGLLLGGCAAEPEFRPLTSEVPPPPVFVKPPVDRGCQADAARYALGRPITQPLLEELLARTGSSSAQTNGAGAPLPTPVDPTRLLVEVDAQGRIRGARCG